MGNGATRRWWALGALTLPVLLISMDATVLGFAVPILSETLEPTSSELLWIVDIYSFILAGLLVTMGVVGDRIGRRRLLMIGATGFSAASLLAAFSTSAPMLIAARAILGVAGATLMPSTLSLIRNLFTHDRERQTAIAIWAAAFAVGTIIGPIIGGFLLEHFWWGSIFIINVPVTAALVAIAPRLIDESRDPNPGAFDLPSAGLSMLTMFPTVYALKTAAEHGPSPTVALAAAIGVGSGIAFVRRQRSLQDPMIDVDLFRLPRFRMAVSGNLLACFGFAGSMYIITQYLQLVLDMTALAAGIALLPAAVAAAVAIMVAPGVSRRIGPFTVIAIGLGIGAIGFLGLSQLTATTPLAYAVLAISIVNAGLSAAVSVAVDGILAAVPPERAGSGAAVSETANELGVALGTAVLGSVITSIYRPRVDGIDLPAPALDIARETLGAAVVVARYLPGKLGDLLVDGARGAFVDGAQLASVVAAVALCAAALWAASSAWNQSRQGKRT